MKVLLHIALDGVSYWRDAPDGFVPADDEDVEISDGGWSVTVDHRHWSLTDRSVTIDFGAHEDVHYEGLATSLTDAGWTTEPPA